MKRQRTDWEKIFANEVINKGLINLQNTQIAHEAQYQKKTKNKNKQTIYIHIFFQGRHTDSKQAHEKMVKITNY